MHRQIQKILLRYKATLLINGKSPDEMYLNRQIPIKLDAIRPFPELEAQQYNG